MRALDFQTKCQMTKSNHQLAEKISVTLRGIIRVRRLQGNVLVARPEFWDRCTLINPNWRNEDTAPRSRTRVYVDGHMDGYKFMPGAVRLRGTKLLPDDDGLP